MTENKLSADIKLRTDAVPEPPRATPDNINTSSEHSNCHNIDANDQDYFVPRSHTRHQTYGEYPAMNMSIQGAITINGSSNVQIGPTFTMLKTFGPKKKTGKKVTKRNASREKPPPNIKCLFSSVIPMTECDILLVNERIREGWKKLGIYLGFSNTKIILWESMGNTKQLNDIVLEMLLDWIHLNDDGATVGVLSKSLWDAGEYDAVAHIVEKFIQ